MDRKEQMYWDERYIDAEKHHEQLKVQSRKNMLGNGSGLGSRGALREMKGFYVNFQVAFNCITSILDVGCGDGYQQQVFNVKEYVGTDFSSEAIKYCQRHHQRKDRIFHRNNRQKERKNTEY